MTQTTFKIPACNLYELNEKMEKLNKKARKLGVAEVSTRVVGVLIEPLSGRRTYEIEVVGLAPRLEGGWTFAGTLEHTPAGNIVRALPGQEIPESFRSTPRTCDHCQKIRNRKDTYLVRAESGEIKQVGHSCVRDYLGHSSPERIAWLATLILEIEAASGGEYGGSARITTIQEFMEMAGCVVIAKGYVSKAAAQAYAEKSGGSAHLETTSSEVWFNLFPDPKLLSDRPGLYVRMTDAGRELGLAALEHAKNLKESSEFAYNLRAIAHKELVERRDGGFLSAAIQSYQKAMSQERERKAKAKAFEGSRHFGEVGKRAEYTLTVIGEHHFPSEFGEEDRILYRLIDEAGNVATWWTTGAKLDNGKAYRLRATVKKHDVYKDINQTVLTRCAVQAEVEGEAVAS